MNMMHWNIEKLQKFAKENPWIGECALDYVNQCIFCFWEAPPYHAIHHLNVFVYRPDELLHYDENGKRVPPTKIGGLGCKETQNFE